MKIAVTYENGSVFQHFGHSEQFKIYQAEEGTVVSSESWEPMEMVTARWPDS